MSLDKSVVCGSLDKSNINRGFLLGGGDNANLAANTTAYYVITGSADWNAVDRAYFRVPFDCIISELRANISVAVGAGETITFTLMVEAAASTLTCQIAGAADVEANDLVNEVQVNEDDNIAMRVVTSATSTTTAPRWCVKVIPTGA